MSNHPLNFKPEKHIFVWKKLSVIDKLKISCSKQFHSKDEMDNTNAVYCVFLNGTLLISEKPFPQIGSSTFWKVFMNKL